MNIAYGSYYLRYLLDQYGGNDCCSRLPLTTAARRTSTAGWRQRVPRAGRSTIDDIPFPETRAYVEKVLQAQRDYRTTYATQLGYR